MWKSTRQLFAPSCELLALAQVVFFAFFGTAGSERSNGLSLITSHVKFFRRGFGHTRGFIFGQEDGGGGAGGAAVVLGLAAR